MFATYILFSQAIGKYYVGYTSLDIQERLRRHNANHKAFTGKTNYWSVVFSQSQPTKSEAISYGEKNKKDRLKDSWRLNISPISASRLSDGRARKHLRDSNPAALT